MSHRDSRSVTPKSSPRSGRSRSFSRSVSRSRLRSRSRSWSSISDDRSRNRSYKRKNRGFRWDSDEDEFSGKRRAPRAVFAGDFFQGQPVTLDASEMRMSMRKRALVLGKFRFISRRSGAEWETTLEFNQAVIKNGVTPIPYASKPLGFRTIPRSRSHTRYSVLNAEFPGIEERYHVAWSTPLGDIHVDSMVKLYDLKSVQTHFVDIDCRGPKSQWFCLVDPRVTPTPDGKIQFDANMFWTVGLLYKHYNTCGVEIWDDEISFMARTHRLAENSAHEGTSASQGSSNTVIHGPSVSQIPAPIGTFMSYHHQEEKEERFTGCITEWRTTYGFVICNRIMGKVFLHSSEIEGGQKCPELPIGTSVSFLLREDHNKGNRAVQAKLFK